MRNYKIQFTLTSLLIAVVLAGCAPSGSGASPFGASFGQIGAGILGSAGVPHADAFFSVGEKLSKATQKLTPEQEYFLGRGVSAMIFSKYPRLANNNLTAYVNRVGNAVAWQSEKPETFGGYHFVVLDTDEVNAMSAPGGFVYVSRGFLKVMPNEDALAAVLAHEVGHIALNHGVDAISQANLTDALMTVGKEAASSYGAGEVQLLVSAFGDSIEDVFSTLIDKGYSRSQEYAADKMAAEILKKAGYAPAGLTAMLGELQRLEDNNSGGWYSTHPSPERRLGQLEDIVTTQAALTPAFNKRTARFKQATKSLS